MSGELSASITAVNRGWARTELIIDPTPSINAVQEAMAARDIRIGAEHERRRKRFVRAAGPAVVETEAELPYGLQPEPHDLEAVMPPKVEPGQEPF
jgi:hypothetical protein